MIPGKIQGNWASPDCHHTSEAMILGQYFYLKSTKADLTLLPGADIKDISQDWILEGDGILKASGRMEYARCMEAPALVPKMMARVMRYLDRIRAQCTVSLKNDCARVLFKMTDANSDKKITPSEIKRTVATAMLFGELAEKKTLTKQESEKLAARSKIESQKVSDFLIISHDKNKSGALDYNEIVENFTPPELPIVKETLIKAGKLLPAFRLAAAGI